MNGVTKIMTEGIDAVFSLFKSGAPGRIRTYDTRFRKPMLYPLSYEGLRCTFTLATS